jgi:hypothetical protein
MTIPGLDAEQERHFRSLKDHVADSELRIEIGKVLGIGRARRDEIFRALFKNSRPFEQLPIKKKATVEYNPLTATAEIVGEDVKTLEELLSICKVDLDVWEVERHLINKWATARRNKRGQIIWDRGAMTGQMTDAGGMSVQPLYQVKVWLKRRIPLDVERVIADIKSDLTKLSPKIKKLTYKKLKNPVLCEIAPFDLHLGKLAWGEEIGDSDYDSKIAAELFITSINNLLGHASRYNVEQFVFPVGQDYLHVDNEMGETTAGTKLDTDTRFRKMFRDGRRLLVTAIDTIKRTAPVDVIVVPGNHDRVSMFHMGDAIECYYHNDKNVTVDNGASERKYYQYGKCLIAYCHGKEEKMSDLPLIMATEEPIKWSTSKWREYHVGHWHHKKSFVQQDSDEFRGVRVLVLPSLSGIDRWHYSKGYRSTRSAEAFLWDKSFGKVATFSYNV